MIQAGIDSEQFGIKQRAPFVVLYHGGCPDGITSAWVFHRIDGNSNDRFIPCQHSDTELPEGLENEIVYVVDFSFSRELVKKLCSIAKQVVILDHHASAQRELDGLEKEIENFGYIFDMNRSGAQIAWDYINPEVLYPWFVSVTAARDLWKWNIYHGSKAYSKALNFERWYTFDKLDELFQMSFSSSSHEEGMFEHLESLGETLLEIDQELIEDAVRKSTLVRFMDKYTIRMGNCPSYLRSEVGHELAKMEDAEFSATWAYDFVSDQWWISLRGDDDTDLSKIAELYGGGGHPKACGFTIKENLHTLFKPL